jgi:TolB-like protein/DNA-binding winged helix-turn-helix (wHTH) protein/thioredoxin-like negative regulator of GroEL
MASPVAKTKLRFGLFEFDLQTVELHRAGRRVRLQEKPLRLLEILLSRPGELVSRAEIQERLWSADTTVDFEDGLNTIVRKLREALGDSVERPRYIETVPKRGYRFIAEVQVPAPLGDDGSRAAAVVDRSNGNGSVSVSPVSHGVSSHGSSSYGPSRSSPTYPADQAPPAPQSRSSGWRRIALLGVVVLAIAFLSLAARLVVRRYAAPRSHPVLAVLPMVNLTGDDSLGYVCDGITEEIITQLASIDGERIGVIARTSAMSYRGTGKTVRQIGEELNAQYVIEGSLQGQKDHLHLIVQLVRVSDQTHVWAQSYDGDRAVIYQALPEISSAITGLLVSPKRDYDVRERPPASFEVHDLYLRGLYFLGQRSREGFESALLNFGRAVELDPRYARGYAELSITYNLMGQYNWMRQEEANAQGRAAAQQALALDPSLAEAHAALGFSDWFYMWNPAAAEKELRQAIALEPNNVNAIHWLAMVMMARGSFKEAERQMQAAIVLDPNALILRTNLGWVHYLARSYPLAVREMEAVVKPNPDFLTAHVKLWWVYSVMNRDTDAWRELEGILKVIQDPVFDQKMQSVYAADGYRAALKFWSNENARDNSYSNAPDRARLLSFAGDYQGAIRELQHGLGTHDGWMVFVEVDPAFDPLHSDPAYRDIVRRVRTSSP